MQSNKNFSKLAIICCRYFFLARPRLFPRQGKRSTFAFRAHSVCIDICRFALLFIPGSFCPEKHKFSTSSCKHLNIKHLYLSTASRKAICLLKGILSPLQKVRSAMPKLSFGHSRRVLLQGQSSPSRPQEATLRLARRLPPHNAMPRTIPLRLLVCDLSLSK